MLIEIEIKLLTRIPKNPPGLPSQPFTSLEIHRLRLVSLIIDTIVLNLEVVI